MDQPGSNRTRALLLPALVAALVGLRALFPLRGRNDVGLAAGADTLFGLLLTLYLCGLAVAVGMELSTRLRIVPDPDDRMRWLFGLALGLGVIAYGVLLLGAVGLLRTGVIVSWLATLSALTSRRLSRIFAQFPGMLKDALRTFRGAARHAKIALIAASAIFGFGFLLTLTPPTDYDALAYHLQGPRLFLDAGRITFLPHIWQANSPFLLEMIDLVGLALGSETVSAGVRLMIGAALCAATYLFSRRYLSLAVSSVSVLILLSYPNFIYWATTANVEVAWAFFILLGMYALFRWRDQRTTAWLILAGICAGLAMGSKVLAIGSVGVLGLFLLWIGRGAGLIRSLRPALLFGLVSGLIAMPWYIKNWVLSGNPLFPLLWGGPGWPLERVVLHTSFHQYFGAGRSALDYLLLPVNLYIHPTRFSTLQGVEYLSFLFPFALLYPAAGRNRTMDALAGIGLGLFAVWTIASQQIRFLVVLFPVLSIVAGYAFIVLVSRIRLRRLRTVLIGVLLGVPLVLSVAFPAVLVAAYNPVPVALGLETEDSFLYRAVNSYAATRFIVDELPAEARVFMMWDSRGYYCDPRCVVDTSQHMPGYLLLNNPTVMGMTAALDSAGITHIYFSTLDARFITSHDPDGHQVRAAEFFRDEYLPSCGRSVYSDFYAGIYEIVCAP